MRKIRITSAPVGGAPANVREAWVGAILPVSEQQTMSSQIAESMGFRARDVATNKEVPQNDPNVGGYAVYMSDAIVSLRAKGAFEAADWWQDYADHHPGDDLLIFGHQFCELVE